MNPNRFYRTTMRLAKFVMSFCILLFVSASSWNLALAWESPSAAYDEIAQRYNLRQVSRVPSGITPIEVNSPAEFEAYLKRWKTSNYAVHTIYRPSSQDVGFLQMIMEGHTATTANVATHIVTRSCSVPFTPATFNVWADIEVKSTGSFRWISSVLNTRTGLTGVTTIVNLSNDWSYSYNQTATSVSVRGGGIVNAYFSTPWGAIYLWS